MSRAIFDAPVILPRAFLTSEMASETSIKLPCLHCRTVSKGSTRWPRRKVTHPLGGTGWGDELQLHRADRQRLHQQSDMAAGAAFEGCSSTTLVTIGNTAL